LAASRRNLRLGAERRLVIGDAYRVVGPLGQGGMGGWWCYGRRAARRDVAIKLIRPALRAIRRASAGISGVMRVRHENVSRSRLRRTTFIVMEYVPGTNVANWLDDGLLEDRLPSVDEARLSRQVCRGVAAIRFGRRTRRPEAQQFADRTGFARRGRDMGLSRLFDPTGRLGDHPMAGTGPWLLSSRALISRELVQRRRVCARRDRIRDAEWPSALRHRDHLADMLVAHSTGRPAAESFGPS
jgi:hypothetical protein